MVNTSKRLPEDVRDLQQWLRSASPRFFDEYDRFRTIISEYVYGDEYRNKPSEVRPAFCGYIAPVVTAALHEKGYDSARTMQGIRGKTKKIEHVWTQVTLGSGEYVVDATHWQFSQQHSKNLFTVFPASELAKRFFWNVEPYVELDECLAYLKPKHRKPVQVLLRRLGETLTGCEMQA